MNVTGYSSVPAIRALESVGLGQCPLNPHQGRGSRMGAVRPESDAPRSDITYCDLQCGNWCLSSWLPFNKDQGEQNKNKIAPKKTHTHTRAWTRQQFRVHLLLKPHGGHAQPIPAASGRAVSKRCLAWVDQVGSLSYGESHQLRLSFQ